METQVSVPAPAGAEPEPVPASVGEAPAPVVLPAPMPSAPELGPSIPPVVRNSPGLFYNARINPQLARPPAAPSQIVLRVAVATALDFDLGPRWKDSDIPDAVPAAEIADSTEDVPLTVVLGCDFCPPDASFKQHITYRSKQGRSEPIRFFFVPQARKDGASYRDELHLVITNGKTGRDIERLSIPVSVTSGEQALADETNTNLSFRSSPVTTSGLLKPDVIIHAIEAKGPSVVFTIEPVSAAMKALLGPDALDGDKPKTFRSGIVDAEMIDQASAFAFSSLSAISMQEAELEKLRATGVDSVITEAARANLVFSASEAGSVAEVIAATGQRLYQEFFFNGADPALARLIELLEGAAATSATPIRVKIVTDRLSLPWQYLLPVGREVDPAQFWGMRFSLSVVRANDGAQGWREKKPASVAHKVLFAHYGTSTDSSVKLAVSQIEKLKLDLPSTAVLPVYAGSDLIKLLRTHKDAITGFVTFMHASSGGTQGAPFLEFGESDKVEAADFMVLKNKVQPADQDLRYLSLAPLVVLNACETGPAMRLTQTKLANSLFKLGVKGIVVTEVSVWQTLGDEVAKRLLARLAKGEPAPDALTAVRRELLNENNNPLGLLYAYYGDPAATLLP